MHRKGRTWTLVDVLYLLRISITLGRRYCFVELVDDDVNDLFLILNSDSFSDFSELWKMLLFFLHYFFLSVRPLWRFSFFLVCYLVLLLLILYRFSYSAWLLFRQVRSFFYLSCAVHFIYSLDTAISGPFKKRKLSQ